MKLPSLSEVQTEAVLEVDMYKIEKAVFMYDHCSRTIILILVNYIQLTNIESYLSNSKHVHSKQR